MNSSILHFQNMPRPQYRPQWATNRSGPYMIGRMMNPSQSMMQTNWSSHYFPPAPPPSIPPTLPYLPPSSQATPPCSPTMPCPPTQPVLSRHTFRPYVRMRQLLRLHQKALATMKRQELAGLISNPHWQDDKDHYDYDNPKSQWTDIPKNHPSISFHSKAGHRRV